jgi:PAS domain S-box-containing protein
VLLAHNSEVRLVATHTNRPQAVDGQTTPQVVGNLDDATLAAVCTMSLVDLPWMLDATSAVVYLALAVFVVARRPALVNWTCAATMALFGLWSASLAACHRPGIDAATAAHYYDLGVLGWGTFGSSASLFVVSFLWPAWLRRPWLWLALIVPAAWVVAAQWQGLLAADYPLRVWGRGYAWRAGAPAYLFFGYYGLYMTLALGAMLREARRGAVAARRRQAWIVGVSAVGTLVLASLTDVLLPELGVTSVPNLGPNFTMLWAVAVVYAILRYRMFELTPTVAADRIVATMKGALFLTNPDGAIAWSNEAASTLFGHPAEALAARPLASLFAAGVALTEQARDVAGRRADGGELVVSVSCSELRDHRGEVVGHVCVANDVTERGREIAARERSEARYRQLIDSMQEGVWVLDAEDRITLASPRMAALLGCTPAAQLGKPAAAFVDPASLAACAAALADAHRGGSSQGDWVLGHGDGARRSAIVQVAPLPRGDGGFEGAVVTATDVTERRKLDLALAHADRLTSVGRLAAGVGHDINNPLTYVLASLEEIIAAPPGEEALAAIKAAAEEARGGVLRVRDIVADLRRLSMSSPIAGEAAVGPLDLRVPVDDAVKFATNELRFRAKVFRQEGADLPLVVGDRVKLSQVFLNLLLNAAHAIPEGNVEGNHVKVRIAREGDRVQVEIEDSGRGIAPEHLTRIFEPFFSTKHAEGGSGLGLAISREIITSLGGGIEASSKLGHGTRFVVWLPASSATAPVPKRATKPMVALPRARVLIVDDEPAIRGGLERMLKRRLEVFTAGSVAEAQARLTAGGIDLVLCDVMMPDGLGLELVDWLRARGDELADRVVLMTGGAFTPDVQARLARGDIPVLEKPFETKAVLRLVDELVG